MTARPFAQVDVFTAVPYRGNPVAVVLDGEGLSDAAMQAFARWTNLSETTFVLPATEPGADYRLRIFTPAQELPFAGHPTLGSAHAVIAAGIAAPREGRLVQQCKAGLVTVSQDDEHLFFTLPPHRTYRATDHDSLAAIIGPALLKAPVDVVHVGPHWAIAELVSEAAVRGLAIDPAALAAYTRRTGIDLTVYAETAEGAVVRSFAPADGIIEDPVCGSGNGAVAVIRRERGQVRAGDRYVALQGREIGRDGRVHVRVTAEGIAIGGACVTCIEGVAAL